jgi:hypothetical protein
MHYCINKPLIRHEDNEPWIMKGLQEAILSLQHGLNMTDAEVSLWRWRVVGGGGGKWRMGGRQQLSPENWTGALDAGRCGALLRRDAGPGDGGAALVPQCHFEGDERDCTEIFIPVITDDGERCI